MEQMAVILPAAGRSARFGGGKSKLLELLAGVPVLRHAVAAFLRRDDVVALVVASPQDDFSLLADALGEFSQDRRVRFCRGGASRAHSVRNALRDVGDDVPWVAVHDAARPLVSQSLIDRTFAGAREHGAAVPALPVTLTIKQAIGPLPAQVERTFPRHTLWAMQTPQIMRAPILRQAFDHCPLPLDQITDDAQLLELAGHDVWLVQGEERNLKITTPSELRLAELLVAHGDG